MVGGVLLAVAGIADFLIMGDEAHSVVAARSTYLIMPALRWTGLLLILLGMVGLYARQAERAGVFGLVAFLVAIVGLVLALGVMWTFAFVPPSLVNVAPEFLDAETPPGILAPALFISFVLALLGMIVMGLSAVWANVLPRWTAVVFSAGIFLSFAIGFLPVEVPVVGDVLFAIAALILGYGIRARKSVITTPAQSMPASA
jgi:hypothetical protein